MTLSSEETKKKRYSTSTHIVLAHSYSLYFAGFVLGIILDFIFPVQVFSRFDSSFLGAVFIVLGSLLIFWAQKTTRNYYTEGETVTKESFLQGPYRYTRSPTHAGLMFMMLGFGFVVNGPFILIFTLITAVVTRFTFLRAEEAILEKKYGAPYEEYKKSVKL